MNEYISREAVFQVVHGIARGIATKDTEALKAKDMKTLYKIKGAKEILDSVDTDLCYIPAADVQPVKHGRWSECYTDSHHYSGICSVCGRASIKSLTESLYEYCPKCGARMDLNSVTHDRCSNYMDCDGSCFIDDTPCDCAGNIEKCKGR